MRPDMQQNRPYVPDITGDAMTDLGAKTVGRAMQLAAAVHEYDATAVADLLVKAKRDDINAMCVALAAMVDVEMSPRTLLAWNDDVSLIPDPSQIRRPPLRPHGTHSAFARHKSHGEQPCAQCVEGERTYQRLRMRRRRSQVA